MVEVEASTVAAAATTTSEGAAAAVAVAAISGAAAEAEEDLVEGAVVEALINSKIKGLRNVSSVSRLQSLTSFALGRESGLCY